MRFRSILIVFVLAVLFGIAAVVMALHWLEGQVSLASRGSVVGVPMVPAKTVVVAAQPLRFGTELKPEHLREIEWPAGAPPSGAFEKVSDILTSEGRRVVLSPIEASEPVLTWKVTGPGERATLSAVVDDGIRAMSVRISDVLGVAGFVLPGDRVDILLTRDNYTDILLQNVKILAIDQTADERHDKPKSGKSATLEVNSVDAQKLTLAQTEGALSLALRAAGSVDETMRWRTDDLGLGPWILVVWLGGGAPSYSTHTYLTKELCEQAVDRAEANAYITVIYVEEGRAEGEPVDIVARCELVHAQ